MGKIFTTIFSSALRMELSQVLLHWNSFSFAACIGQLNWIHFNKDEMVSIMMWNTEEKRCLKQQFDYIWQEQEAMKTYKSSTLLVTFAMQVMTWTPQRIPENSWCHWESLKEIPAPCSYLCLACVTKVGCWFCCLLKKPTAINITFTHASKRWSGNWKKKLCLL